uniref:ran GTPase-activating protein 1-like n=1 Tax=Styela clava TaxID=7725 RepID=UPI0019393281|nr:ran GTPase-activating protein 1-like [Styela clava]
MSKNDKVDEIASLLQKTEVRQQNIVSFKGQGLKLNNEEDAKKVIQAIRDCPDLQVLELCGNTIGVEAARAIADSLDDRKELERCLWADMFTGRLRSEIPPSLTSLSSSIMKAGAHLVEIDLSDNAFGPIGIKSIAELLKSEASYTLQVLKFNNNGMGIGGKTLAETLIECHRRSSACGKPLALKVFIAGRNRLENPGAIALAKAFKTIGTLEEIHMPQNGINHEGISALAEAVRNSPNLRHLNLNDNTFSNKGALSMAKAVGEINSLEIINFGDCLVRTEGAVAIGEALRISNPNLHTLILAFGEIQLEGAISICNGVAEKEHLELLDLNGNQFGDDGVDEVQDLAKELGYLKALGSLSDDEGVDSEADDNEDEDEEDEEEGSESPEEEDDSLTPQMNGYHGVDTSSVTFEDFPDRISAQQLVVLGSRRNELLHQAVLKLGNDVEACIDACSRISGLIETPNFSDKTKLESTVFECANVYLRSAFQHCEDNPMRAVDRILIRAGLIKSEDKSIKALPNVRPFLQVLKHALAQPYYPQTTRKALRAMVAKTCKIWDKNVDIQSQLLQMLY